MPAARKLGRLPPRHDPRTLTMATYVKPELPPPPDTCAWSGKVADWPMMLNDRIGDCAIVAPGHQIQSWTANVGMQFTPSDVDIVKAYSAVSGYDPATGANDNGCVELDVLKYWRNVGIAGRKIGAFVAIEPSNHHQIREATWLFGGVYVGLSLPLAAQQQPVWSAPVNPWLAHFFPVYRPGSWGGHAVYIVDYDARGLTCITWGAMKRMTWGFLDSYCEEAWGILSNDWFDSTGKAPNGFDLPALQADLAEVAKQ